MNVLFIGSGPSSLAAITEYLSKFPTHSISVIDIGAIQSSKVTSTISPKGLKRYFDSDHAFDLNRHVSLTHKEMKPVVWPSSSLGGFSRVWGAALDEDPDQTFQDFLTLDPKNISNEFFTLGALKILAKIGRKLTRFTKLGNELLVHRLAINQDLCVKCGNCITGCPQDAIWFSGNIVKNLKNINYIQGQVTRLHLVDDEVGVSILGLNEIKYFDRVFLGAGPIGTSAIILRSDFGQDKVAFKDSQTFFIPGFRLPIRKNSNSFTLSQIAIRNRVNSKIGWHAQLYPDTSNFKSRARELAPFGRFGRGLISITWPYISKFTCVAIAYLPSENSGSLETELLKNGDLQLRAYSANSKICKENLKSIIKTLRVGGIYTSRYIVKYGEPGEGYHFGSGNYKFVEGSIGELIDGRIWIIDSSALKNINDGPITNQIVKNSKKIIRNIEK